MRPEIMNKHNLMTVLVALGSTMALFVVVSMSHRRDESSRFLNTSDVKLAKSEQSPGIQELYNLAHAPVNADARENSSATKRIFFQGTSFAYNESLASEVKAEVISASALKDETDKPEGVEPEHVAFIFMGAYASRHVSSFFSPRLQIYSIAEYKKALALSPQYVRQLEDDIQTLKTKLAERPASWDREIPFLPFGMDASEAFQGKIKYLDFKSGKGILFLTQYNIEPALINNQGLSYIFQGLTDDGLYYISAHFPVNAPFLPEDYDVTKLENYTLPVFYSRNRESNEKKYRAYLNKIAHKLEELPPNKYEPDLTLIDELVQSLDVARR